MQISQVHNANFASNSLDLCSVEKSDKFYFENLVLKWEKAFLKPNLVCLFEGCAFTEYDFG